MAKDLNLNFPFSLRFRLLLFAILAALPALLPVVVLDQERRQHDGEEAQQAALRLARELVSAQELLIDETRVLLTTLALLPDLQPDPTTPCDSEPFLATLLAQSNRYTSFATATPNGDILCSAPP